MTPEQSFAQQWERSIAKLIEARDELIALRRWYDASNLSTTLADADVTNTDKLTLINSLTTVETRVVAAMTAGDLTNLYNVRG